MTQTIPNEAIEAAARACRIITVDALTMDECRDAMRIGLTAALPHLSASDDGVAVKADTVHRFAQEYEHREPDLTPTDIERMMIEDAINGFLSEHALTPANLPGTTGGAKYPPSHSLGDLERDLATPAPSEATSGDVAGPYGMMPGYDHEKEYERFHTWMTVHTGSDAELSATETIAEAHDLWIKRGRPDALASLDQPKTGSADGALREVKETRSRYLTAARDALNRSGISTEAAILADNAISEAFAALSHSAASTHSPTKTDGEFERGVRACIDWLNEEADEVFRVPADLITESEKRIAGQYRYSAQRIERALLPADKREDPDLAPACHAGICSADECVVCNSTHQDPGSSSDRQGE